MSQDDKNDECCGQGGKWRCACGGRSKEEAIAKEMQLPERIIWLSFADPKSRKFLGVAVTRARGVITATQKLYDLGANPGGEVVGCFIGEDDVKPEHMDILMSEAMLIAEGYLVSEDQYVNRRVEDCGST